MTTNVRQTLTAARERIRTTRISPMEIALAHAAQRLLDEAGATGETSTSIPIYHSFNDQKGCGFVKKLENGTFVIDIREHRFIVQEKDGFYKPDDPQWFMVWLLMGHHRCERSCR